MNTVRFKAHEYREEGRGIFLDIFIDDEPLSLILGNHLGSARGFGPIRFPRKAKYHFLGYKDFHDECRGRKYILDCSCGCMGCDEIFCKITVEEDRVIWSDFFGTYVNVSDFEGFVFDEAQYHQELEILANSSGYR